MKRIIFAFLIFIPSYTNGQSESLRFGMKLEFYAHTLHSIEIESLENETYAKRFTLSPVPSMYFIVTKDLSESFSLGLKPGILLKPELFGGFEFGLFVDYKFPNNILLNGGINIHIPPETSHGTQRYEETNSAPIFFIFFGIGYRITNVFHIDIAYHHALNPEFGHTSYNLTHYSSGPLKLYSMLKVGFVIAP